MAVLALLVPLGVNPGEIGECELVRAAAADDGEAFGRLVRLHQGVVRGMLRRLVGNNALADDLAQTAFVRAWEKRHTFSPGSFRAWLCTLAYRVAIAHLRKRTPEAPAEEPTMSSQSVAEAVPRAATDCSASMDIGRAIDDLPTEQKRAIVLSFQAGLSHAEIAAATGWPLGTVKSHIARAKQRLQRVLQGYHDHD